MRRLLTASAAALAAAALAWVLFALVISLFLLPLRWLAPLIGA